MSAYSTHRKARNMGDAVRLFCLECCGSSVEFGAEYAAVKECPNNAHCSLWPYRFGKNPHHARAVAAREKKQGLTPEGVAK